MTNCPELRLLLSLPDPNGSEQLTSTTDQDMSAADCCSNLNQQSLSAATAEGRWRNVAAACFTTGDHQFKSACIRITNLFGSGFSSSLPPAWNKPDRSGGNGSDRELVPSFSRDIFLVATLLEVLGVYTDWRSAGGRRRIPSYTELRIRTKRVV